MRQIIEYMLKEYDDSLSVQIACPEENDTDSNSSPSYSQLYAILLASKPIRRALNAICEYKNLEVGDDV